MRVHIFLIDGSNLQSTNCWRQEKHRALSMREMLFRQHRGGWQVKVPETSFSQRSARLLGRPYLQREGSPKFIIGSSDLVRTPKAPTVSERSIQRRASLLAASVHAGPDLREMRSQPRGSGAFTGTPQLRSAIFQRKFSPQSQTRRRHKRIRNSEVLKRCYNDDI
jgi:hypothetical protein